MKIFNTFAVTVLLAAMAGCSQKPAPPAASAPSTPTPPAPQTPVQTASTTADEQTLDASTDDLRLNDEFVSPDAASESVSDEPLTPEEEQMPEGAFDPLADADSPAAVEVKFIASATTNIAVAGRQQTYAREIEQRNERVRSRDQAQAAKDRAP